MVWGGAERSGKVPLAALFQDGRALTSVLIALFFFCLMNVYFLVNWMPGLLQKAKSTQRESILATTTLFNTRGIFGAVILGRLIDRFGYLKVITTGLLCTITFMVVLATNQLPTQTLLVLALVGGGFVNGGQGALNSLPSLIYGDSLRATATGWSVGIGRLGFVGPLIAGFLLHLQWTSSQVLLTAALAPLTAIILLRAVALSCQRREAATRT